MFRAVYTEYRNDDEGGNMITDAVVIMFQTCFVQNKGPATRPRSWVHIYLSGLQSYGLLYSDIDGFAV